MSESRQTRTDVVLVTGGAGFIGSALSTHLAALGPVVAVDNLLPQVHPDQSRPEGLDSRVELVVADVTQPGTWDELLTRCRPSLLIHLAAETGTGQSLTESTRHAEVNVVGTTVMLDALVRHDALPDHVVLTSSRAVYGEGLWVDADGAEFYPPPRSHAQLAAAKWDHVAPSGSPGRPTASGARTTHPNPSSVYGSTKLAQELILRNWTAAFSTPLSVFRLQNVYGPGQSPHNPYTGIITLFHRLASQGQALDIYEDGDIGRDFIVIDDVVSALMAGITQPPTADQPRILDVGTGVVTTIADAARAIAKHHGAPDPQVSGKFRDGDVRHAVADVAELQSELNWQWQHDFEAGSAAVADYLQERGFLG